MPTIGNRVKETTTTAGTGAYSLGGAYNAYVRFRDRVADGAKTFYYITDDTDYEVGIGTLTYGSPDSLARTTILASSNANAAVAWAAGSKEIGLDLPAEFLVLNAVLHNLSATTEPTVNDDVGDGYGPGSLWLATISTRKFLFICASSGAGAAVWHQIQLDTAYQNDASQAADASGSNAFALGGGQATGANSVAIYGTSSGDNSVCINSADAAGDNSVAIGVDAETDAAASYAVGLSGGVAMGYSSIAAGEACESDGEGSIALGEAAISGGDGSIAMGFETEVASGATGAVALGHSCLASKPYSQAFGKIADAEWAGATVVGGGQLDATKNVWTSRIDSGPLWKKTTDATPAELELLGSAATYGYNTLQASTGCSVLSFYGTVTAHDGSGNAAGWEFKGVLKRLAGTTTLLAGSSVTALDSASQLSGASVAITADNTNDTLTITVTGIAATTIYWNATYGGTLTDQFTA